MEEERRTHTPAVGRPSAAPAGSIGPIEATPGRAGLLRRRAPDGRLLVTRAMSEARLWDIETGRCVRTWYHSAQDHLDFTPDGEFIVDGLGLVNPVTGKRVVTYSPCTTWSSRLERIEEIRAQA